MSSRIGTSSYAGSSGSCDFLRPNTGSVNQCRHGVDQHPCQATDDGAVDPDELQVATDVEFDPLGGLPAVPALDRVGDHGRGLLAVALHQPDGCVGRGGVELGTQFGVIDDPT